MMTVHEVSALTGVSIRTLQYYDRIGLLRPAGRTDAGYRLYDDASMETLQQILLYRELEFPLKDIREMMCSPSFDRRKALEQQIRLLEMRRERLEQLILHARSIMEKGENSLDFTAFDDGKIQEYARQARESWGGTEEFREYEQKAENRTGEETRQLAEGLMRIFEEFGTLRGEDPASPAVQQTVKKLQGYITEHYYTCSESVLRGLGEMYAGGGAFTENIDRAGGEGTAGFVRDAIRIYTDR